MTVFDDKEEVFERLVKDPTPQQMATRLLRLLREVRREANEIAPHVGLSRASKPIFDSEVTQQLNSIDSAEAVHSVYRLTGDAIAWAEKLHRHLGEQSNG